MVRRVASLGRFGRCFSSRVFWGGVAFSAPLAKPPVKVSAVLAGEPVGLFPDAVSPSGPLARPLLESAGLPWAKVAKPAVPVTGASQDVDVAPSGSRGKRGPKTAAGTQPAIDVEFDASSKVSAARVRIEVADEKTANDNGAHRLAVKVSRLDDGAEDVPVSVALDYRAFAGTMGAHWEERLELYQLPDCPLAKNAKRCEAKPVVVDGFVNDLAAGELRAKIVLPSLKGPIPVAVAAADTAAPVPSSLVVASTTAAPVPLSATTTVPPSPVPVSVVAPAKSATGTTNAVSTSPTPGSVTSAAAVSVPTSTTVAKLTSTTPVAATTTVAKTTTTVAASTTVAAAPVTAAVARVAAVTLAAVAGPSGPSGSYTATPLGPDAKWDVGVSSGGFSWSYPIDIPGAAAGATPGVSLSYSSQAVDGMTTSQNAQGSEVGVGWNLSGAGFIERRFQSCYEVAFPRDGTSTDTCWRNDNASISLNGHATEMVPTGSNNEWRLKDDPAWRVQKLSGAVGNGRATADSDGEYWVVTSTDGTQYWFGWGLEVTTGASSLTTGSAWTVPVFGKAGEPCYGSSGHWCQKAWRWNLDHVVDTNGNVTNYVWSPQTNNYGRQGQPTLSTSYVRGGTLAAISYTKRAGNESANPPYVVRFKTVDRCSEGAGVGGGACPAMTTANSGSWPDVPVDQVCSSSTYCTNYSVTYFSQKRLDAVDVILPATNKVITRYQLGAEMQLNNLANDYRLWLRTITKIGDPNGTPIVAPDVRFEGLDSTCRHELTTILCTPGVSSRS